MTVYAFWNNKGGTGKTSLCFQVSCAYAHKHKDERVLVIDACPQANLSELLLGGMSNNGSQRLLSRQGEIPRATIGGYFQLRIPHPFRMPRLTAGDFITRPFEFNPMIPENIDLICGDPILELQANAMSTLANSRLPGTNTWLAVIDWLSDYLIEIQDEYDTVFIDTNPSFSLYTQIALSSSDRLVLPVMADDSSRRAIQNAFALVHGLRLPSPIYEEYTFAKLLTAEARALPLVHLIAKNRLTQYMGTSSAYQAVLKSINGDLTRLIRSNPEILTFDRTPQGLVSIRDFGTTGVVAFARGCPFYEMRPARYEVGGRRVQVNGDQLTPAVEAIDKVVARL